jgi:hypothetical protein
MLSLVVEHFFSYQRCMVIAAEVKGTVMPANCLQDACGQVIRPPRNWL